MKTILKFICAVAAVLAMTLPATAAGKDSDNSRFAGKTMCVFGDSYVRNHRCPYSETWHAKVADRLGMKYENRGRNGSSIAFDRTKEGFGPAMTERVSELPDTVDYLIIIAGHNDADMVQKNGDFEAFKTGLDKLLSSLRLRYPEAKIGYVTPWNVDRPYFKEVIAQIKKTCKKHKVPVLDAASTSGIDVRNIEFRKKYFQGGTGQDTAHLNDEGHNLLLDYGEAFIRKL